MSWYRTGTVAVTNGSKTVTGVGTLFTTAVNVGDGFALVDGNLNPTGAWYEVDAVVSNTEITLKQSYAGTTGSNNQYCVFNMVGNMTTPSFAQRLATFFASFQSLIDKPTTTPTALGIPVADANGDIDSGWLKDASSTTKGIIELATPAEVLAGTDAERAVTPDTLTDKILGTVSQSGGVPTGAVIEQGSNANGEYVKFADGTMIASAGLSLTETNNNGSGTTGALPATFIANPTVNSLSSITSVSGSACRVVEATATVTTYKGKIITISNGGTVTGAGDDYVRFLVIGRWY